MSALRPFTGFPAGLTIASVFFLLFSRVGHMADLYFKIFSLLEFAGAFAFGILFYRFRYFAFAFAIIALPRVLSIALGRDSHNLLFCAFAGLGLGIFAHAFLKARRAGSGHESKDVTGSEPDAAMAMLLLVFISFLAIRALLEYYALGPAASLSDALTLKDRLVDPRVSANYAFYLSLLTTVNLLGPLLFIIADAGARRLIPDDLNEGDISRGLLGGLALGAVLCLVVVALQEAGVKRLFAGAARSLEHARPPGLFTDSGSAAVLLPVTVYALYLYFAHLREDIASRVYGAMGGVLILVLFAAAIHQGRGYLLSLAGLGLGVLLIKLLRAKGRSRLKIIAVLFAFLVLAPAALWLAAGWVPAANRLTSELTAAFLSLNDPAAAYAQLDPIRAGLFQAGLKVFREHVLIGSGINSFMVETAPLVRAGKIAADNPATLFMGVLSDTGLLGSLFLSFFVVVYGANLIRLFQGNSTGYALAFRVCALPLFCLPAFFVGYHVVFAEFCAFLLMPMLFWPRRTPMAGPALYAAAILLTVYAVATAVILFLQS